MRNHVIAAFILACAFQTGAPLAQEAGVAGGNAAFAAWLEGLRGEALDAGISEASVDLAFSEITPPVRRIIENDRNQPEAVQTYADYVGARVSAWRINGGRERLGTHAGLLEEVSREYGVQPRFLLAIWGMETNYGTYPIPEPLFNVLATLAYDDRRADFYRAQFMDALAILDSGFPGYDRMKGSWAGAMGQSQFLPENYLKLAVDHDGDGRRDIWESPADVLASIANYLKSFGWRDDQTWGRRVRLPEGGEEALAARQGGGLTPDAHCQRYTGLGVWRDLQEWQALGVRRADGGALPSRSIPAALLVGDAGDGEGYLVYRNFCSIMGYNPAFKYALSIGLLSDEFAGE